MRAEVDALGMVRTVHVQIEAQTGVLDAHAKAFFAVLARLEIELHAVAIDRDLLGHAGERSSRVQGSERSLDAAHRSLEAMTMLARGNA